jgi:hypothetical protein|tara:strand:- start:269 stop:625 length:357 start_codon:yes stop_codon:yes gene_type:complete
MKNLKPKIEKVLVKTINDYAPFKGNYKAYMENNKVMVVDTDPEYEDKGEEWFFVPEYDHEEAYCFMCDGGYGWELVNPCEANYPSYDFEEDLDKNFKEAGLFCEPYSSWKHIVTEVSI